MLRLMLPMLLVISACATTTSTMGSEDLKPRVFTANFDRVWGEALNAAASVSWEITNTEKASGIINAKTPMSLWTYGDNVTIRVIQMDEGRVRVELASTSAQAFDWGKNKRNIERFYTALSRGLSY
jgi:hypothetical protein